MPTLSKNYLEAGQQISRDGDKWGPDALGTSATVTYGFRPNGAALPVYELGAFFGESNLSGFQEFTVDQKLQAKKAISLWDDLANINFVFAEPGSGEFPDNPDVFMSTYFDPTDKKGGFAIGPDSAFYAGDIWLDRANEPTNTTRPDVGMAIGTDFFRALMHEIGHAIGLQHPAEYDASNKVPPTYAANATYLEDSRQFSIMSYFRESNTNGGADFGPATTPLLHDIAAIQRLYGANWNTRTGADVYGFNGTAGEAYTITVHTDNRSFAIWDGAGNDTLDFSGYGDSQYITLVAALAIQPSAEVQFSSVGGNTKNVVIAPGVVIENAIGGSGSDVIIGNQVANILDGRVGIDTMAGGQGSDTYYVDNESDVVNDALAVAVDDGAIDQIYATCSYSLENTFAENLALFSAFGNFSLTGNASRNELDGNAGNNVFRGNGGGDASVLGSGDIMSGGNGDDYYYVNVQDSIVEIAGFGRDVLFSNDYTLSAGVEVEVLEGLTLLGQGAHLVGNEFANAFNGGKGFDDFDGGAGNDVIDGHLLFNSSTIGNLLKGGAGLDDITGDDGADTISGGDDADTIDARKGNDEINGGAGADTIDGGDGTDTSIYYGSSTGVTVALQGYTFVNGFSLNTVAAGSRGGDAQGDVLTSIENLNGSFFADTLIGNSGVNVIFGSSGNDRIAGAAGNDILEGGEQADRVEGGDGNDTLFGDLEGSTGTYTGGNDTLNGGAGNDRLQGGRANDSLSGGDGNDILIGNSFAGDLSDTDSIVFGLNSANDDVDYLDGGAGNDFYYLVGSEDTVVEAVNGGIDELRVVTKTAGSFSTSFDLSVAGYENVENLTYLASHDSRFVQVDPNIPFFEFVTTVETLKFSGTGNALNNKITGADKDDNLQGLGGDDTLIGGLGGDTLNGGDNNDTVSYATSAGAVEASFSNITKPLFGNVITLLAAGFRGNDAEGDIVSNCENITGSAFADKLGGNAAANVLSGGNGNDTLYGGLGADTLIGGRDNDTLNGGGGADFMFGGAGDDTYEVDDAGDIASEQSSIINFFLDDGGYDTVNTNFEIFTLGSFIEVLNYTAFGTASFIGTGNASSNRIFGGNGNDILSGGAGADYLNAGFGTADIADYRTSTGTNVTVNLLLDTASGGHAQGDTLDGIDGLYGSLTQRDILIGDNANNVLKGFGGNDSLIGNDGDDFIEGGAGADTINGGAGVNDWASYRDSNMGQVSINLLTATHSGGDAQGDSLFFIENLEGSLARRDILIGNFVANRIFGNGGVDSIQGGDGNDFIDGGTGGDSLNAGAGIDTLSYEKSAAGVTVDLNVALQVSDGDANGDSLFFFENVNGSDFGDNIKGNLVSNRLVGGLGADTLNGGLGSDYLTGGADADTFRFTDLTFGSDTILDWQDGSDHISMALTIADAFSDFAITGNGTAHAVIKIIGVPGSAITVNAAAPFTLDAGDFVFV